MVRNPTQQHQRRRTPRHPQNPTPTNNTKPPRPHHRTRHHHQRRNQQRLHTRRQMLPSGLTPLQTHRTQRRTTLQRHPRTNHPNLHQQLHHPCRHLHPRHTTTTKSQRNTHQHIQPKLNHKQTHTNTPRHHIKILHHPTRKTLLENQAPQPQPGEETKHSSRTTLTSNQQNKLLKLADQAVANATPYAWGGGSIHGTGQGTTQWDTSGDALYNRDDLKKGFDCSSLVQYLHYQATGKDMGRTTHDQLNNGLTPIKETDKQIGDLGYRGNNHVVMYVGANKS